MELVTCLVLSNVLNESDITHLVSWFDTVQPGTGLFANASLRNIGDQDALRTMARLDKMSRALLEAKFERKLRLEKVWLQRTGSQTAAGFADDASPFLPHIDVYRRWKAMLYLDHVTTGNGPFMSSFLDPEDYEFGRSTVETMVKTGITPQAAFAEVLPWLKDVELRGVLGGPGDLLLFDTNTPHSAGPVQSGLERRVIRLDYLTPSVFREQRLRFAMGSLRRAVLRAAQP